MEPFSTEMFSNVLKENIRRLEKAYSFEEADRVPIVIGLGGPYYAKFFGYTFAEYYNNLSVMLDAQIKDIKWRFSWLKDDFTAVGVFLDTGSISEGIFFGCEVELPNEVNPWKSPWIIPCIKNLEDIDMLEVPDPRNHLGVKEYYDRLEKFEKMAKNYYSDIPIGGRFQIHPPISAAGSLLGPRRLYY